MGADIGRFLLIVVALAFFSCSEANNGVSLQGSGNQVSVKTLDMVPRQRRSPTFDIVANMINLVDTNIAKQRVKRRSKEEGLIKSKYIAANKITSDSVTSEKIFADLISGDQIFAEKLTVKGKGPDSQVDEKNAKNTETIKAPVHFLKSNALSPPQKSDFVHDGTLGESGVTVDKIDKQGKTTNATGKMMKMLFPESQPKPETEENAMKKFQDMVAKLLGNSDGGSIKANEIEAKTVNSAYIKAKEIDANNIKSKQLFAKHLIVRQDKKNESKTKKQKRKKKSKL